MALELPSYFDGFIKNVKLTQAQRAAAKAGQEDLRKKIAADDRLRPIIESTFLQGSYRRGTGVKPLNGARADVDVVVVTNLSRDDYPNPEKVFTDFFLPFVEDNYDDFDPDRGHSIAIRLPDVDLDLVPTSAPSLEVQKAVFSESVSDDTPLDELEPGEWRLTQGWRSRATRLDRLDQFIEKVSREPEWKTEPLWIPDRDKHEWERTHPIEQLSWTSAKNRNCNGHYLDIVRAVRWWRRRNPTPKYPKGYPVEHIVGHVLADGTASVAAGIVEVFESIRDDFRIHAATQQVPFLPDHGVAEHNVLGRLTGEDFAAFHVLAEAAATTALDAYGQDDRGEAVRRWRDLFGEEFPDDPDKGSGGYPKVSGPAVVPSTRWG